MAFTNNVGRFIVWINPPMQLTCSIDREQCHKTILCSDRFNACKEIIQYIIGSVIKKQ